jgi:hypothetical protein
VSIRWVRVVLTALARMHGVRKLKNNCIEYEGWRLRRGSDTDATTEGREREDVKLPGEDVEDGFGKDSAIIPCYVVAPSECR